MNYLKISWVMMCYLILTTAPLQAQQYFINTFAGGGSFENALAIGVSLNKPRDVAIDTDGNIYVAAQAAHSVYKITPNGTISTIAGTGSSGTPVNNVPGNQSPLNSPAGLAIDASGNVFIADRFNHQIRKVDAVTGVITTVAGNGSTTLLNQPFDVAVDQAGNLYIADLLNHRIRKRNASDGNLVTIAGTGSGFSGDGGPATSARLNGPSGVEIDANGNIYIADKNNNRIRKINQSGIISTLVMVSTPDKVTFDKNGNLYVASNNLHQVLRVSGSSTIAAAGSGNQGFSGDGGTATSAQLNTPTGIAIDNSGNIYVTDFNNNRVRKVSGNNIINTFAGNGSTDSNLGFSGDNQVATSALFYNPNDIAIDANGNLFIADRDNHRIRKVNTSDHIITTIAGTGVLGFSGDGGQATSATINSPNSIAVYQNSLYIIVGNRIRKIDNNGVITLIAGTGSSLGDNGPATSAQLSAPRGLAFDSQGNLYFAESGTHRIRKIDGNGIITTIAGNGSAGFAGDGGNANSAQFDNPFDVFIDKDDNLFIVDRGNERIRKINASDGNISTIAGGGTSTNDMVLATSAKLSLPYGVLVDQEGNIFISDSGNNKIRMVNSSGIINTIAGQNTPGFSGDGGLATNGKLYENRDLAIDAQGRLYIADKSNHRIRQLVPATEINLKQGTSSLANNSTYDIGNLAYNPQDTTIQVLVENQGTSWLFVNNINATGDFTITSSPANNIAPGNNGVITLSVDLKTLGAKSTTLTLTSNDLNESTYTVTITATVTKADQSITFDLGANNTKTFGETDFNLNATATSGETVTYVSSDANVATITGNTVTIVGVGTANITASQTGNSNYNAATNVTQTLTVNKANQTITFELGNNATKVVGDANFNLAASGGASGNTVTFASSDTNVATIAGNTVTIVGQGTTTITASQAGNNNYNAAIDVAQTLTVQSTITALPDNLKEGKLIIFPNPVANQLRVKVEGKAGSQRLQISLLNYQGQIVNKGSYQLTNGQINLPVNQLPSGTYLLQIQVGNQTILRKIIKK